MIIYLLCKVVCLFVFQAKIFQIMLAPTMLLVSLESPQQVVGGCTNGFVMFRPMILQELLNIE
jgi:hypothetical protein